MCHEVNLSRAHGFSNFKCVVICRECVERDYEPWFQNKVRSEQVKAWNGNSPPAAAKEVKGISRPRNAIS